MIILGIESSCDECSLALVERGRTIISHVIHSQIPDHEKYGGVVPEIASRKHTEWILPLYHRCMAEAGHPRTSEGTATPEHSVRPEHSIRPEQIDAVAVTTEPGLSGSLLVGASFAKGLSLSLGVPLIAVDHILAHLYAPRIGTGLTPPYLGLLLSGGHTIICRVDEWDRVDVLGSTTDDACGEAFDKIAKFMNFGYPGGVAVERLAAHGDPYAYDFPESRLPESAHRYDVSYSGLKTAVTAQRERFRRPEVEETPENIAASFQRVAIDMVLRRVERAIGDTGITRLAVGGGVAANSYLRKRLSQFSEVDVYIPPMQLCTDNAAMIAGIGYEYAKAGRYASLDVAVNAKVAGYRRQG